MATPYTRYYVSTDELKSRFKPSLTNYFDVHIMGDFGDVRNDEIGFLAYEAVLPGTSYNTTEVFGDRQGVTETFANKRVYPPVDVSFYVDNEYKVIRYFEQWMAKISPNSGVTYTSYNKFRYPGTSSADGYKRDITIAKFERDFHQPGVRLDEPRIAKEPESICQYILRRAYPVNLISLPLSYDGGNILRTTVTFNYDVYAYVPKTGEINQPLDGGSDAQPGGDSAAAAPGAANQVRPNSLLTQAEYNAAYAQGFAQTFGGADKVPKNFKNPRSQQLLDQYNQTQNK